MIQEFKVAIGKNRFQKVWKNEVYTWEKWAVKLAKVYRTKETILEWEQLDADSRSNIKDIGGFICGTLVNGNRSQVTSRNMLCLDADFADKDFIDLIELLFGYNCIIYSTHSHNPKLDKYRYRLIVRLDREVSTIEYPILCDWVMNTIGEIYFDKTSIQANRLMYWPSCSVDSVWEYREIKGDVLKTDEVLKACKGNGEDLLDREKIWNPNKVKQADPLSKEGLVGIFCKKYSISSAIEHFLADTYIEGRNGRYTYTGGQSSNGLCVYNDLFAYSHHESDPCSMRECNSYDLVRLHKFGDSKKSEKLMNDYILSIKELKSQYYAQKNKEFIDDFGEGAKEIISELEYTRQGQIAKTIKNACLLIENRLKLKTNLLKEKGMIEISGADWMKNQEEVRTFEDSDYSFIYMLLEKYNIAKWKIDEAVKAIAAKNNYNPILDKLKSLKGKWDGVKRAETIFIDCFGASDNKYVRYVTKMWLAGAVWRMVKPGCQFDYMIVLNSVEGLKKSSFCNHISYGYFINTISLMDTKDHKKAAEKIKGKWIVEFAELEGIRKTEEEAIKNFISTRCDVYRPSYGRSIIDSQRNCVFIGTTNQENYLQSITGNRRFLPISCKKEWDGKLDVDQLWAEVLTFYKDQPIYPTKEIEAYAETIQNSHLDVSLEKTEMLNDYINMKVPSDWYEKDIWQRQTYYNDYHKIKNHSNYKVRAYVTTIEIWCELFGRVKTEINNRETKDIIRMLKSLNYEYKISKRIPIYGMQRMYQKKE